jgi:tryptophanyl-tRNA synthetase
MAAHPVPSRRGAEAREKEEMGTATQQRTLSGMQSSGRLHLGNYMGALRGWLRLQETTEAFFFVADWHALSTNYHDPGRIAPFTRAMVADWLASGLDPERCVIFQQSRVPEHAVLHVLFSMITPLPWLERNPTYKEQIANIADRDLATYGFLGYPVLQAADILIYKPDAVPVGVDQLPHVELTREIARRFNHLYGDVFPIPNTPLTETPKLPGLDGRKMSKSYGNAVFLSDTPAERWDKIRTMVTDPARVRRSDPGDPDKCPVFDLHRAFSDESTQKECAEGQAPPQRLPGRLVHAHLRGAHPPPRRPRRRGARGGGGFPQGPGRGPDDPGRGVRGHGNPAPCRLIRAAFGGESPVRGGSDFNMS